MDFNATKEEAEYRAKASACIAENLPTEQEPEGLDEVAQAKIWQRRKFDAGWACLRWPKEFGGRDASPVEQ